MQTGPGAGAGAGNGPLQGAPTGAASPAPTPTAATTAAAAGADPIDAAHMAMKAQFDKVTEAKAHLDTLRNELTKLDQLGDFIQPDDVVKSAATLVGKGFHPQELATLLADMPMQGGEMLQQWVATHSQMLAQLEAQVGPVMATVKHGLATSALHVLMRDHMQKTGQPPATAQGTASLAAAASNPTPSKPLNTGLAISDLTPQGNA